MTFFSGKYKREYSYSLITTNNAMHAFCFRYLYKLKRLSIFGIEVDEKIELDKTFDMFLPDVFMYDSYVYAISLSKINTSRTYWITGTVNLLHDANLQKSALEKDKKRLKFFDHHLLSKTKQIKEKRFTVVALCSISEDEWNERTQVLHANLSEVFEGITFEYFLRGSKRGHISFDTDDMNLNFSDFNYDPRKNFESGIKNDSTKELKIFGKFFHVIL